MRFRYFFFSALRIALPVLLGWAFSRELEAPAGMLYMSAVAVVMPVLGVLLVRNSEPGRVTWKNYVAGYCVPWGYAIGRGQLWAIAVVSGVVWLLLQLIGFFATQLRVDGGTTDSAAFAPWFQAALIFGWVTNGLALLHLLGLLRHGMSFRDAHCRRVLKIAGFVFALVVVSVLLALMGYVRTAALIAAGPNLAVGLLYLAWFGILLTFGRNLRWN